MSSENLLDDKAVEEGHTDTDGETETETGDGTQSDDSFVTSDDEGEDVSATEFAAAVYHVSRSATKDALVAEYKAYRTADESRKRQHDSNIAASLLRQQQPKAAKPAPAFTLASAACAARRAASNVAPLAAPSMQVNAFTLLMNNARQPKKAGLNVIRK